ncbi:unnamed protein product [Rotaria sp. Silwood2]|nr:unnamed protein product [Rotaria sp. Silwood2]
MKFWCATAKSSKQQKFLKKTTIKSNDSLSSSVSYATISSISIRKCDSGFSETASSIQTSTCFEQILVLERTYHENLKQNIIKYSRPLRRYLNPNEIVDLFQNIEKISAISQSIVRHCEKLFDEDNTFHVPISIIYQSCLDVMTDSYNTYISRSIQVQAILKQYCHKIAYFLQVYHQTKAKMTSGYSVLQMKEDDVLKILAAQLHIGSKDVDYQMDTYVWKKKPRSEGSSVINIRKFWEKLMLAARAIVAVENPADVCAISCQPQGQRAVLKFAKYTGATAIAGRFTPGSFTNQIQAAFKEPRLIIITNPHVDHQAVSEASFVNIPVIAFCDPSTPLRYIDIAIPCNNKANKSIGLMWWFLTREVLRLRGEINRQAPWDVMVDLFFYRDPEETEKEDQVGVTGQEREVQQHTSDANYYDDGPSIMPASENFAGNQDNWGASADENWSAGATGTTVEPRDWSAAAAVPSTTPGW